MIRSFLPWYLRIGAKLLISRLPFSYDFWSKIGFFRHGSMDDHFYVWSVLKKHSSVLNGTDNWKGLELGPGDSLLSAFLAPALGSSGLSLVDAGDFSHKDLDKYRREISEFLSIYPGSVVADLSKKSNVNNILKSVGSSYFTDGIASLGGLKENSYDLIYSHAVLEHVRSKEFKDTIKECFRLLKPDGVMSHVVDFKDHLGGGLNNMRFSSTLWEKEWFAYNSGFYTNRIRLSEMIQICEKVGFIVEIKDTKSWNLLPIKRTKLALEFKDLSDKDLLVSGAHLVMRCQ